LSKLKDLGFAFILCLFIFEVPCVGVSIGIERIFSILEAKAEVIYNFHVYYNVSKRRGDLMECALRTPDRAVRVPSSETQGQLVGAGKNFAGAKKFGPG